MSDPYSWQAACRKFAQEVMAPHVRHYDETRTFPTLVHEHPDADEIRNAPFPEELGGRGISCTDFAGGIAELSAVCPGMAWTLMFNRGALHPVINGGTEEQRELFVTRLLKNNGYAALGLTEPENGSNLIAAKTRAVKTADGWLLNGAKCMSGNGAVADLFVVLADTVVDSRRRGLSFFVVPRDAAGVTVSDDIQKEAFRSLPTTSMTFQDVALDPIHLIGPVGGGANLLEDVLSSIRIGGAACGIGLVTALLHDATKWANNRRVYPDIRLDTLSHVQLFMARLYVDLCAARHLLAEATTRVDSGLTFSKESSMAKYISTELAVRATNEVVQLYGWRGIASDYEVEKRWRDARALTIFEGSSEIQLINVYRDMKRTIMSGADL